MEELELEQIMDIDVDELSDEELLAEMPTPKETPSEKVEQKISDADLIAAFLANGGKVTQIVPQAKPEVERELQSTRTQRRGPDGTYIPHRSRLNLYESSTESSF
jgi:hypothetical protein